MTKNERLAELQSDLFRLGGQRRALMSALNAGLNDEQTAYVTDFIVHVESQIKAVLDALLELDPAQN